MSSFAFSEDFESAHFSLLPSFNQDLMNDEFEAEFPMIPDFNEDEEYGLFQSCTGEFDENEELLPMKEGSSVEDNLRAEFQESGSNFQIQESGSTEMSLKKKPKNAPKKTKVTGSRKKDQNMCKKYNLVAQNVVGKKLKLTAAVEEFKKDKHRQDFFLIMVICANKAGKLEAFKKCYRSSIEKVTNTCTHMMKQTFKESFEFKKNQALLDAIDRSFQCIQLYEENKLEEAIYVLFDLKNLRNKKFIERSIQFVCAINSTTQNN